MSRYNERHADSGRRTSPEMGSNRIAVCGYDSSIASFAVEPGKSTCSKCLAKHYEALIPASVKLVRWQQPGKAYNDYRSVYEFHLDGVHRAFICADNGWGAGWSVHSVDNHPETGAIRVARYVVEFERHHKAFGARAQAALAVYDRITSPTPGDNASWFAPAVTPAAYLEEQRREATRRRDHAEQERVDGIASANERMGELQALLTQQGDYLTALRGINVEAPSSALALKWAIELAKKQIENTKGCVETVTTRLANLHAKKVA